MQTSTEAPTKTSDVQIATGLAEHLIGLRGSEWAFWRCMCLRGAGFPADEVLKLGAPEHVRSAADSALQAEETAQAACDMALQEVMAALDRLRSENRWDDKAKRNALLKARDRLKARELPKSSPETATLRSILEFQLARQQSADARQAFAEKMDAFVLQTSNLLRQEAASPHFREAVLWQNRTAVHSALDSLLRNPPQRGTRSSRQRQNEELVASYLQRYCIKNDTIGFFGPVGWAHFVPEGPPIVVNPGPNLVATRKVYFETWPIEALASVIARDPAVYPWLAPLVTPYVRAAGSVLRHPFYGISRITPIQSAIINSCDGNSTARELARKFVALPNSPFGSESDFYNCLNELVGKRVIFWNFNIPFDAHPERSLREALHQIGDEKARARATAMLDQLDSARLAVEAAAGDTEKLDQALEHLDSTFTSLTQVAARRSSGKTYAGRTLIYEDCRRDAEVSLGPELLQVLAQPLSLLLHSARWLTNGIAKAYRSEFHRIYSEQVHATGKHSVDAELFWVRAMPLLAIEETTLAEPVKKEFQHKWDKILRIGDQTAPLNYSSEELCERIEEEFTASSPGWANGTYHCPDLMIAGTQEEILRGEYVLVLGELHLGGNTITASLFVNQHPAPQELIHAVECDLGTPNVVPVTPKTPELVSRTAPSLISPLDFRLEYALDSFARDRSRALSISAFVIEEVDGELIARTRDGKLQCDALELVGGRFSDMVLDSFQMLAPRPHCPRITIDRLVIKRESWRFKIAELPFVMETDPAERFLQARKWVRSRSLPGRVFYKVPIERKPSYLDFDSPVLLDIFCKMVRRTEEAGLSGATVNMSEMFPTTEQLWLTDAENSRFTSELRIVAVDLARAAAPLPVMKTTPSCGVAREGLAERMPQQNRQEICV